MRLIMAAELHHSFPPSIAPAAQVLILGSMPGMESLRRQQYYAHPRNAFWKIMGELVGFEAALPYEERLLALRKARIALWDTMAACHREGSLDSNIRDATPNDITGLLKDYPGIRLVLCNGTASYNALRRFFPSLPVPAMRLPSTSPAAAMYTYVEKREAWRKALREYLPHDRT